MITIRRTAKCLGNLVLAGLVGVASHSVANASLVTWTISGGTFSQGGAFSGHFTFDADVAGGAAITNWSISVTASSGFSAFTYDSSDSTPSNGGACCGGFEVFQFTSNASGAAKRFFFIPFNPNLTDAGGTVNAIVSPGNSSELTNNFANERDVSAGAANGVAAATPEPGTLSTLAVSLLLAGAALRKRSSQEQPR